MRTLVPAVPLRAAQQEARRPPSWRGALAFVEACFARQEQRRQLGELTDDQLEDIGLSRADARRERRRWPWDGPTRDG